MVEKYFTVCGRVSIAFQLGRLIFFEDEFVEVFVIIVGLDGGASVVEVGLLVFGRIALFCDLSFLYV